ncbi:MAG: hypothetical protein A2007_05460 [Verrucomicrobia bacterium GWC2_42_7]|nr:MAG: hypothetical protein A2007_05460 [Verrucomicrobia bacterium GWC2_42_7]
MEHREDKKRLSSWRDIDQTKGHRSLTPIARWKKLQYYGKLIGSAAIVVCCVLGALWALRIVQIKSRSIRVEGVTQILKRIDFETDGILTGQWCKDFLKLPESVPFMDVNLFQVKTQLESFGQVRSVVVERQFPDTLKIHIEEYRPVLRIAVKEDSKPAQLFLISKEGIVYQGVGYQREIIGKLPFLTGVPLNKVGNSFQRLEGMEIISRLISLANIKKPHLYANWKSLSCEQFDHRVGAEWSRIRVSTKDVGEVIFGTQDFSEQLDRLDFIVKNLKASQKEGRVEYIDLSTDTQAAVQLTSVFTGKKQSQVRQ